MTTKPPRLAGWLLKLIPQPDREFIEGDLEEEYAARAPLGRKRASAWYWHQVLATLPSFGLRATRERLTKAITPPDLQWRNLAMASATPHAPAFGSILIASKPGRQKSTLATSLMSMVLHGGLLGGLVYSTIDQRIEPVMDEVQVVELNQDLVVAPPPPPPPVEQAAPVLGPPLDLIAPDHILDVIPPPGQVEITPDIFNRPDTARDTTDDRTDEVAIGETPSFTPVEVAPAMRNREEVGRALEREYPPLLRDAGVGGRVEVWIRLDEQGDVQGVQVNESSGRPSLDDAALRVARIIEFSPAMNRDKPVPVWVSIPITFQVR